MVVKRRILLARALPVVPRHLAVVSGFGEAICICDHGYRPSEDLTCIIDDGGEGMILLVRMLPAVTTVLVSSVSTTKPFVFATTVTTATALITFRL